jgi:hypothetical protein
MKFFAIEILEQLRHDEKWLARASDALGSRNPGQIRTKTPQRLSLSQQSAGTFLPSQ